MRNERVSEPYSRASAAQSHEPVGDGEITVAAPDGEVGDVSSRVDSGDSLPVASAPVGAPPEDGEGHAHWEERAAVFPPLSSQSPPTEPVPPRQLAAQPPGPNPANAVPAYVPWQAGDAWGVTTLHISANTAAGASYLFWWISGFLIYFSERHNRYVRFHALQSIILTGVLTILGVSAVLFAAVMQDLAAATHQPIFYHLGIWGSLLLALAILFAWLCMMTAAWTGNYLQLPVIGTYAERYAAPPAEPTGNPLL